LSLLAEILILQISDKQIFLTLLKQSAILVMMVSIVEPYIKLKF